MGGEEKEGKVRNFERGRFGELLVAGFRKSTLY